MIRDEAICEKVVSLLERRLGELAEAIHGGASRPQALNDEWNLYLESIGAQRVGKLVGMCYEVEPDRVRVADPISAGDNQGFIEMHEETARRIVTLGLP